jgi:hypothetical protein
VIVDNSRVALLDNIVKKQEGEIEDLTNELRLTKQQRNKAVLTLLALLLLWAAYLFRKPILTFLSGGWSKLLSVVRR